MASQRSSAERLSEALGVDLETSCAALAKFGGDANAAAGAILASGQQGGGGGGGGGGPAASALGTLLEMGYARAEAEQALAATGGDLEEALSLLLSGVNAQAPPAELAGGDAAGMEVDLGVCAICCEELRATDAAMRCAGRAGSHHYGHAACLAQWVQRCRRDGATPSCPTCRGPLQLHRRNLREFLQQGTAGTSSDTWQASGCQVSQEDSELLRSMLDQEGGRRDEEDSWCDIDVERLATGLLAAGALAALAFGTKALIDHFGKESDRSRR